MTICEDCAVLFPRIGHLFDEREAIGMERYGAPLDPDKDDRDFVAEAVDELTDGIVYITAAMKQIVDEAEANEKAARQWQKLQDIRFRLAIDLASLLEEP